MAILEVEGPEAGKVFAMESGGHRWQRVPPTEKRGRVHTSTVTVAVMGEPSERELRIEPRDLDWKVCRGSGPGGQHRNMTESAVQLTHRPTGLSVRIESERSQHANKAAALAVLRARLQGKLDEEENGRRAEDRRDKVGTGMRGDKVRTIRAQDGIVTDHRTGKKTSLRAFLRGDLSGLR